MPASAEEKEALRAAEKEDAVVVELGEGEENGKRKGKGKGKKKLAAENEKVPTKAKGRAENTSDIDGVVGVMKQTGKKRTREVEEVMEVANRRVVGLLCHCRSYWCS